MINVIILHSDGLDIFLGILCIIFIGVLFYGFTVFNEKYLGVRITDRYHMRSTARTIKFEEGFLRMQDPSMVQEAITRCKKKHYVLTSHNILEEIEKIKKEKTEIAQEIKLGDSNPAIKFQDVKSEIDDIKQIVPSYFRKNNPEILDGFLEELKKEGIISEKELDELKKRNREN